MTKNCVRHLRAQDVHFHEKAGVLGGIRHLGGKARGIAASSQSAGGVDPVQAKVQHLRGGRSPTFRLLSCVLFPRQLGPYAWQA